ncbi:MAG: CvpA family protein [Lachnospiraceae bacterium]|nr:CvpA family protein [Lachnospiraceae bacterium]
MNYGILLDIAIVVLLGLGYMKGYKRGIMTMAIPVIAFIVGMIGLKTIGSLTYVIFGETIENAVQEYLLRKIADTELIKIIFGQMIDDALIKKVCQMVWFVIVYALGSATATYLLTHMKLSINNMFINSLDKNFGGAVGVISHVITVMLILGIFSILIGTNEEHELWTLINSSYIGKFMYTINPIRLLLG